MPIRNGSFENGRLEGWRTIGDTSIKTAEYGVIPYHGDFQALLTNDFSDSGGSVVISDLEKFLDLEPGHLEDFPPNDDGIEGSAIKQTFSAKAGEKLEFSYNFLTGGPRTFFNDFAYIILKNHTTGGSSMSRIEDREGAILVDSSTPFPKETGYLERCYPFFSQDGTYTVGFVVIDVGNANAPSGLLIDNIRLVEECEVPVE